MIVGTGKGDIGFGPEGKEEVRVVEGGTVTADTETGPEGKAGARGVTEAGSESTGKAGGGEAERMARVNSCNWASTARRMLGEEIAGVVAAVRVERFTGRDDVGGREDAEWEFEVRESEKQELA